MIVSIRHKGLAAFFYNGETKGLKQSLLKRISHILALLNTAFVVEDTNLPGLKMHKLKGELADFYPVSASGNWRVVFRFEDGHAYDVDLMDYH